MFEANPGWYQINCTDYCWSYIGESGRALNTRRKEHEENVKQLNHVRVDLIKHIAKHAWNNNHEIEFENGKVIEKSNYWQRFTLELQCAAITEIVDNNSKHLPELYRFLLKKRGIYYS